MGFVNFPMDEFGVQQHSLKDVARTASFLSAKEKTAAKNRVVILWQGAKVKNLETMEEASSVGVSLDTGGVLVSQLPAGSVAAKWGLRQGDLIVAVDGKQIENVTYLQKIFQAPGSVEVIRDQHRQSLKLKAASNL